MKLKKSVFCILLAIILLILIAPKTMAANLTISFSSSQAKAGDTVTATVVGNGIIGKVDLSVSGNATLSQNSIFVDGSASVSVKINGEGDVKITATAVDMAYSATGEAFPNETDKGKKSTAGTIKVASVQLQTMVILQTMVLQAIHQMEAHQVIHLMEIHQEIVRKGHQQVQKQKNQVMQI